MESPGRKPDFLDVKRLFLFRNSCKERQNTNYFVFIKYLINCLSVSFDTSFSISQFALKALEIIIFSSVN